LNDKSQITNSGYIVNLHSRKSDNYELQKFHRLNRL